VESFILGCKRPACGPFEVSPNAPLITHENNFAFKVHLLTGKSQGHGGLGFVITLILLANVSRSTGRQNAEIFTITVG
jgi:hypothetical protein